MKLLSICLATLTVALGITRGNQATPLPVAEELRTVTGEICPGKIVSVHGTAVVVATKKTHSIVSLAKLDDESLAKVADFLTSVPASPPRWEGSTSAVAKSLSKNLVISQGEKLVPLVLGDRPEPEFYLAYFSAHWCPPCRRFTPVLVEQYAKLQAKYPHTFELVFLSDDESSGDQARYVREAKMPWPVVKFSAADSIGPFQKWHGSGIPDLIVTNREGHVIFKSYVGDEYVGPDTVLEQFSQLLAETDPANTTTRRARHRLESIRHLRASAHTTLAAKPYLLSLDPWRYQSLSTHSFTATLTIDATGKVTDVIATTPELPYILKSQFESDAADWLFLPSAANGKAQSCTVQIPIHL